MCITNHPVLAIYYSYIYIPILVTFVPIVILIIFGILTFRNIRKLIIRVQLSNADRQIAVMVCLQVILALIGTVSYGTYNIYQTITAKNIKDSVQVGKDSLFLSVAALISICHFGVNNILF